MREIFFKESTVDAPSCKIRSEVNIPLINVRNEVHFVSFHNLIDKKDHVAICVGNWRAHKHPLVRIHSECLTGDVFASQRCDCGKQLEEALQLMDRESGIILYLRQEGRGIGLYNKLDAYKHQINGMDTYEANHALGFADDLRDFQVAAQMLQALDRTEIRLLSNNPRKVETLERHGITVCERVGTGIYFSEFNKNYLLAKKNRGQHQIDI